MQSVDQIKKRPKIECYGHFMTGHIIPILKIIQVLQKKSPNLDVSFMAGPLTIRKFQKLYPHIHMVPVQDEFDETTQKQMAGKNMIEQLGFFLNYMHTYFQQKTDKPDLIIADFFMLQAMNYANKNGVKFIVNNPNSYAGMSGVYNVLSLERSIRVQGYTILYPLPSPPMLNMFDKMFDAFRNRGVLIFDSFVGLDDPAILPSNHTLVGLLPSSVTSHQEIETQLTDWINGWRKKGKSKFLYISFGSMLKLSEELIKKLVRVIQKLQYPTIWSIRSPNAHLIQSELIYHREWLPQQLILQQEDVRGYLTHGGWGSASEAIATQTPMVCIPVFGDQGITSKLIHKRHIGIMIDPLLDNEIPALLDVLVQEQIIANAISKIMEDASYFQSMKRMSRLSKTHDTAQNISALVDRLLEFGCEYLISAAYEDATIKDNSVPLKDILVQKYWPLLQKKH